MTTTEVAESDDSAVRRRFRRLHESGCFVLPNPWDAGGAKLLQSLGFKALATTSAGAAWSHGRRDGGLTLNEVLEHLRVMVSATTLPVTADFESGFAEDAEGVARHVRLAIDTGVAGLSIEDASGDRESPLRSITESVERIRAARSAIDAAGADAVLVARAENFWVGRPDLQDVVARLRAYAAAGADCLYAPGLKTREQIKIVVNAVAPKPVNLLVSAPTDLTVQEIQALGVRRISVGGALARAAWGGFLKAARDVASSGRFDGFAGAPSGLEINALMGGGLDR